MNIQEIRKRRNLTVKQLADLSNLPQRTVEAAIHRDTCSVTTAIKLADALNVTLDELCRTKPNEVTEQK